MLLPSVGVIFLTLIHIFQMLEVQLIAVPQVWGFSLKSITSVPLGLKRSAEFTLALLYKYVPHTHTLAQAGILWGRCVTGTAAYTIAPQRVINLIWRARRRALLCEDLLNGSGSRQQPGIRNQRRLHRGGTFPDVTTEFDALFVSGADSPKASAALISTPLWNRFLSSLCFSSSVFFCVCVSAPHRFGFCCF